MLRSLVLDILLTLPVMLFPRAFSIGTLLLAFPLLFIATLANIFHILIYRSTISTFAIQSIFETTSNEAGEFITDFFSLPNVFVILCVLVILVLLLVKAIKVRKRARTRISFGILLLILCLPIAVSAVHKGDRLLASHGSYQFFKTLFRYADEVRSVGDVRAQRMGLSLAPVTFWMETPNHRVRMYSS